MLSKRLAFVVSILFIAATTLTAQNYDYIGSTKCKMCHNKSTTGAQYKVWLAGPHAKAMKTLSSEKALAYAKEHGIADPAKEAKCIKCHSTYGSIDQNLNAGIKIAEGVSCESCHGAGSGYKSASVMKDKAKATAKGLIVPGEKLCVTCHNKDNPFFKPFNYAENVKKIAHPNPSK